MSEPIDQNNLEDNPAAQTEVWPPPPTNVPSLTEPYAPAFAFVPVQRLARAIMILLFIDCLFSVYAGLSAALLTSQAARATATEIAAFFQAVLLLAAGICFFVWMYRMDKNLRAFQAEELQFRPGWAVGYFFVPIMNLYRPYQVLCEIWQASVSDPAARTKGGRRSIHPPALLGVWWGFWLLWSVVDGLASGCFRVGIQRGSRPVSAGCRDPRDLRRSPLHKTSAGNRSAACADFLSGCSFSHGLSCAALVQLLKVAGQFLHKSFRLA